MRIRELITSVYADPSEWTESELKRWLEAVSASYRPLFPVLNLIVFPLSSNSLIEGSCW